MMHKNVLITGGAGFIGSHLARLFVNKYPNYNITVLDKLTYCGNLENLKDLENKPNYTFVKGDICDYNFVRELIGLHDITDVIHLAAESHVDRSITDPFIFAKTNILGTMTLLEAVKDYWNGKKDNHIFYHVSTDEVYGSLNMEDEPFKETNKYQPHSPYSASKASSDHMVRAYHDTYGLPTVISNCSNNYGGNQFPEKLIPLIINNLKNNKKIPIYGNGLNVRDWLYVEDHVKAIDLIFHNGTIGETYNIGGNNEKTNIDLIKAVMKAYDEIELKMFIEENPDAMIDFQYTQFDDVVTYVTDRKGHDLRYAIDSTKLQTELGWKPTETFESGIYKTVEWYLRNEKWLNNVTSGEYLDYYKTQYYTSKS